jgi:YD repeat-containing protein
LYTAAYDAQYRVVSGWPGSPLGAFEYDSSGRLVTAKDELDLATGRPGFRYEYDGTLLTAVTNSEGERTEYAYDGARRITQIRPIGGPDPVHSFSYSGPDPVSGLYQTTYTDPLGHDPLSMTIGAG